ncbi:MAG: hypothetical protein QOE11_3141 [Solirubrobacteraceae bacterium]|jgi:hypothetical protein|nr:hypothetical protein [Solirubrobacteraceae bacterium]
MSRHLRIAGTVATCALAAGAAAGAGAGPAAGAAGATCAKTASVSHGTVLVLAGGGDAKTLRRGPYYVTTGPATVHFGHAAYKVGADTIFDLACSGAAGGAADTPSVNVEMGSASVRTGGASSFGTLSSDEMLLDPYADKKMRIKVTRTPMGDPTIEDAVAQGPSALRLGTTVAKQVGGAGAFLNITPFVGSAHRTNGQCHQAHGATTVTTAFANRYPQGTVTYSGLAPFSPR